MEIAERGQYFEQEPECRVQAGDDAGIASGVECVGESPAGNEFGDDGQPAFLVLLEIAGMREAFVIELRHGVATSDQGPLERGELRPQDETLRHLARLAIEREHTPPKTVLETGGRERRSGVGGRPGH